MRIAIKTIKEEEENTSVNACLQMILSFYGVIVSSEEIDRFFAENDKDSIAYPTLVALFAKRKGLEVECVGYNLFYFDPADFRLSPEELQNKLKHVKLSHLEGGNWLGAIDSTLKALNGGVNYKIQKPSIAVILSYLEKKCPVMVTVNDCILYERQGNIYRSHYILLNGIEESTFSYIDPVDGKVHTISEEDLLFALLGRKLIADDAYLIAFSI